MNSLGKTLRSIITIVIVIGALSGCASTESDGFDKLFNGENLDGWYLKTKGEDAEIAKKVFAVENGMVHIFNDEFPDEFKLGTGENDTHGLFYTTKKV